MFIRQGNNVIAIVQTISRPRFKEDVGAKKVTLTEISCRWRDNTAQDGVVSHRGKLVFFEQLAIPACALLPETVLYVLGRIDVQSFMKKSGTHELGTVIIVEGWFPRITDPYRFLDALRARHPHGIPPDAMK